jgi:tripartite-type tricarboxylate transporter receptor subunit TctC
MRTHHLPERPVARRSAAWHLTACRMFKSNRLLGVVLLLAAAVQPVSAGEDSSWPGRPVRWVIPFPVGGSVDIVGRIVGQKLLNAWGRPVVVDNRPGVGGRIGTQLGATAAPDGYTQTLTLNTTLTSDNILSGKSEIDTQRVFAPITIIAATSQLLVVNAGLPVRSVRDLVGLAKGQPGKLNYGSSGPGGSLHLAMELLKFRTGIDIVHVPYKGGPPAAIDVMGGQLAAMFLNTPAALPLVKTGKLRTLGVSTAKRSPLLPDVPTIAESGVAGFDTSVWYGLLAPAATQKAIVSKVRHDVVAALADAEVRPLLLNAGAEPVGNTPSEFAARVRDETASWAKVIKAANIRVD